MTTSSILSCLNDTIVYSISDQLTPKLISTSLSDFFKELGMRMRLLTLEKCG